MKMAYPLLLSNFLERANRLYAKKEIVSRDFSGEMRYTYGDFYRRVTQLANALTKLGVQRQDRVATFAWNNHRHLELYFAVPAMGAVIHTVNIRLFPDQLVYILNHAADKVIFVDEDLVPILERVADKLATVRHFVIMTDRTTPLETKLSPVSYYEELLAQSPAGYDFPKDLDENSAAGLCYTTATTGNPKGVVYTHRGIFLHSLAISLPDAAGISETDVIMPVVPMFHANAWGIPFAATMAGAKQVLPGARPDARTFLQLMEKEKVTLSLGVPTVWMGVMQLLEKENYDLSSLRAVLCGGSAPPRSLIEAFERKTGALFLHAYGMTETYPLVTVARPKSYMKDWPAEKIYEKRAKQGALVPGLEMKLVNEKGVEVAHDGKELGELLLKGAWIIEEYYNDPRTAGSFSDGWLRTGDMATIDEEGYVQIMDRAKDLIKSGGEWISSVDLENTIMAHPAVLEAAVIAMPHEKWQERPLACVVLRPEYRGQVTQEDILDFLRNKVSKWWLPDRVDFLESIPKTSVGKFSKRQLREWYAANNFERPAMVSGQGS